MVGVIIATVIVVGFATGSTSAVLLSAFIVAMVGGVVTLIRRDKPPKGMPPVLSAKDRELKASLGYCHNCMPPGHGDCSSPPEPGCPCCVDGTVRAEHWAHIQALIERDKRQGPAHL